MRKAEVIRRSKEHEDEIRAFKVQTLYLYGATVRCEATAASAIDVVIDPTPGFSFVELVGLEDHLEQRHPG